MATIRLKAPAAVPFRKSRLYHLCLCMPKTHRISSKKVISYQDIYGEHLLMQAEGNSPINNQIRNDIKKNILKLSSRMFPVIMI